MKRSSVIFLWLSFLTICSYAQTVNKGNMYIGGFGNWDNSKFHKLEGTILLRYEYLAQNKLSIGTDLGYRTSHWDKCIDAEAISEKFNIYAVPTQILINREGIVRFIQVGADADTIFDLLESEIRKYL